MKNLPFFVFLAVSFAIVSLAHADEITLKSGEKLVNVKVVKKTDDKWRIETANGKKMWINVDEIVSHVEKETVNDIFEKKADAIGKKDIESMIGLAQWGQENGADVAAAKLLAQVLRLDKDNELARELQ